MTHMTTTVRLPEDLYEALRTRAFEEHRPVAEVIREALRRFLDMQLESSSLPDLESDPFWTAVGTVDGGPGDESVEHDHYLYGAPKKLRR
jgi:Arc/MetJ-type ribon-helix-helix transcriptional regulator